MGGTDGTLAAGSFEDFDFSDVSWDFDFSDVSWDFDFDLSWLDDLSWAWPAADVCLCCGRPLNTRTEHNGTEHKD